MESSRGHAWNDIMQDIRTHEHLWCGCGMCYVCRIVRNKHPALKTNAHLPQRNLMALTEIGSIRSAPRATACTVRRTILYILVESFTATLETTRRHTKDRPQKEGDCIAHVDICRSGRNHANKTRLSSRANRSNGTSFDNTGSIKYAEHLGRQETHPALQKFVGVGAF